MPAKSAAQQKAAGAALAAKRGEISPSELKGASKSMYESMTEQELDDMASTKRKGKPEHVSRARATQPSYCSRTSTLSAAPAESVTVSRTKPGPSGLEEQVARIRLHVERHAVHAAPSAAACRRRS